MSSTEHGCDPRSACSGRGGDAAKSAFEPEWIGLRLSVVSNFYSLSLYDTLHRELGILRDEAAAIVCIAVRNCNKAQDIVNLTGRPKNPISRAIRSLEKNGLICRSDDINDRRASRLSLTTAGREAFGRIQSVAARHDAELMRALTGEERRNLDQIVDKLQRFDAGIAEQPDSR